MSSTPPRSAPASTEIATFTLGHPGVSAPQNVAAPPSGTSGAAPPVARAAPHVTTCHGDLRVDDYFWLRDRTDPEVIAYLEAENRHTEAAMAHTAGLQERLYRELVGRIAETDLSVPEWYAGYFYYVRTEAGRQYPIVCRKRGSLDAAEEVVLDQNLEAAGHAYFRVGVVEVSPDQQLLAYSVDTTGAENYTLYVRDLRTGALVPEAIPNTSYGVEWANDNRTLFYTVLDDARRPHRLFRHRLGTNPVDDVLVYHEADPAFFLDITKTKSREFLILELASHTTSEARFLRADQPEGDFVLVAPREPGTEYTVTHHGDRFFIVTNDGAVNSKLMEAPVIDPSKPNWRPVVPHRETVKLDGVEAFRRHLVLWERKDGLRQIRLTDLATGSCREVRFPEPVYTVGQSSNPDFDSHLLRFTYTSLVTPASVIDYDMDNGRWDLRKRTEVRGYDSSGYQSERLLAQASDSVEIPLSIVYRKPLLRDGRRPLVLFGYGAYGSSFEPAFSPSYLSLLDRDFVVAIAHVRGGEEMGRHWYDDGKLLRKRNTITDFTTAAEHLVREGYTASDRLVIGGGSAGGLLMGAAVNLRPELFAAVLADVPFVDVVNTMLDASLPLTVIEYEEWGNPADPEHYAYLKSYSPYDNVEAKAYPHLLVTAGLNDPRVAYWEPAKWTAKLRALKTDQNRLLLKTNMGAGHGGPSGRYDNLREVAFKYAFVLDVLRRGDETGEIMGGGP